MNPRYATDSSVQESTLLPIDFVPSENDVICGRGSECFNHVGNQRFRYIVDQRLDEYTQPNNKFTKSNIISEIMQQIRNKCPFGGFIKKDLISGRYMAVGDTIAREKTSQAFRDALSTRKKSTRIVSRKKGKYVLNNAFKSIPQTTTLSSQGNNVFTSSPYQNSTQENVSDYSLNNQLTMSSSRETFNVIKQIMSMDANTHQQPSFSSSIPADPLSMEVQLRNIQNLLKFNANDDFLRSCNSTATTMPLQAFSRRYSAIEMGKEDIACILSEWRNK